MKCSARTCSGSFAGGAAKGEQVVLIVDSNEDVTDGVICRQLRSADIGMREAVHAAMGGKGPNTYFRGSEPINEMWTTTEIEVTSAAYLPYGP